MIQIDFPKLTGSDKVGSTWNLEPFLRILGAELNKDHASIRVGGMEFRISKRNEP